MTKLFPVVGGPLNGQQLGLKDFYSQSGKPGGAYYRPAGQAAAFAKEYHRYNNADRSSVSAVWLHTSVLHPPAVLPQPLPEPVVVSRPGEIHFFSVYAPVADEQQLADALAPLETEGLLVGGEDASARLGLYCLSGEEGCEEITVILEQAGISKALVCVESS